MLFMMNSMFLAVRVKCAETCRCSLTAVMALRVVAAHNQVWVVGTNILPEAGANSEC